MMITDMVQEAIDKGRDYYSCWNCDIGYCMNYIAKNKICSGVVKNPDENVPFDVIRLCIKTTSEQIQTYDYTPDEANSVITVLNQSIGDWMGNTKAYQRFRMGMAGRE